MHCIEASHPVQEAGMADQGQPNPPEGNEAAPPPSALDRRSFFWELHDSCLLQPGPNSVEFSIEKICGSNAKENNNLPFLRVS
eukprot:scaffold7867_cov50-Prasinocladus_malaysianus.AAC.1